MQWLQSIRLLQVRFLTPSHVSFSHFLFVYTRRNKTDIFAPHALMYCAGSPIDWQLLADPVINKVRRWYKKFNVKCFRFLVLKWVLRLKLRLCRTAQRNNLPDPLGNGRFLHLMPHITNISANVQHRRLCNVITFQTHSAPVVSYTSCFT